MSEIEELVERLQAALDTIDWLGRPVFPKLREPATDAAIAAYEATVGRELPASYKSFLKLHNGMEGLEQYDWGVSGVTEVAKGDSFDDVVSGHVFVYKDKNPKHMVLRDLDASFVAGSDFDYQIVYFDPETMTDAEPRLRRVSIDQAYEHYPVFKSFTEFLGFVVHMYEELIDLQGEDFSMGADLNDLLGQEQLLKELAQILDTGAAPEPEEEPMQLNPEMERAARLCSMTLNNLIDRDLVEVMEGPGMREALEDYMMRKLLKSRSQDETVKNWISALSKAREVEELYGTDEELVEVMNEAFEAIASGG